MIENAKRERRSEISFLNVLFCLLVIFIHIISYAVSSFKSGSISYNIAMFPWRSASFVVQGFVMLSGLKLFLTGKDNMPYAKWLKIRFKSIVIPYAVCFAVYYVFYMIVYDYPLDVIFILKQFTTGNLVCHLYFIPIMVQFDLLMPLWKRIINSCSPAIVIPFCILFSQIFEIYLPEMVRICFPNYTFIYNDRLFTTYLAMYIIGCYIGKNYDCFVKLLKDNFKTVCVCFGLTIPLFVYYTYLAFNYIAYIPFANQIHSLYVFCVIFFVYGLSLKFAPKIMPKIKLIKKTDAVSYDIYLWHMLFLLGTNYLIEKMGIMSQIWAFSIRMVVVYTATISFCIILRKAKKLRR